MTPNQSAKTRPEPSVAVRRAGLLHGHPVPWPFILAPRPQSPLPVAYHAHLQGLSGRANISSRMQNADEGRGSAWVVVLKFESLVAACGRCDRNSLIEKTRPEPTLVVGQLPESSLRNPF